MSLTGILKKFSIIVVAIIALIISRLGVGYLVILLAIGIVMALISKNKKDAIITGALYATISYILSYPSGLFLKDYMPDIDIPVVVSPLDVASDLFLGWLIPVMVAVIICAIGAIIGLIINKILSENTDYVPSKEEEHYFENSGEEFRSNVNNNLNFTKKEKKQILSSTPIQKAKNKYKKDE